MDCAAHIIPDFAPANRGGPCKEESGVGAGFGGKATETGTNTFSRERASPAPRPWQRFASRIFAVAFCDGND
jgi:hypothetical protein